MFRTRQLLTGLAMASLVVCASIGTASAAEASPVAVAVVTAPAPVPTRAPSIVGVLRVGSPSKIDVGTWSGTLPTTTFTCQWLRDGIEDGPAGSCKTTRSFEARDIGHQFTVRVTVAGAGHETATAITKVVQAYGGPPAVNTVLPTIDGTAEVGSVLVVATNGEWSPTPATFTYSYKWLADGIFIDSEISSTHRVSSTDVGKRLSLQVAASRPGYQFGYAISVSTTPVPKMAAPANTVRPVVTGTAQVGTTLSASPGTWSQPGLTFAYQWYANGTSIPQATASTYQVDGSLLGAKLAVRVNATSPLYADASATSLVTSVVTVGPRPTNTTLPALSGTAQVGEVLTVTTGTWSAPGLTYAYAWYRDGVVITGAASSSHTVSAADTGHRLTAQVTVSETGYNTATATSAPSATVTAAAAAK
ncbi:hypothetical protein B7R21_06220 [Subtercola boreus]|uniref:Ig-like domain-containing protein n=1 Tax=Subtercola boreus TaxID=120213 RepID=A0A3E0W0E7_9MICO|nr:hypothetical protein [Subtercola boreus]RFA14537.1 hypothetical protein B7R21_06220 [Subtercola boreus]